MIKKSGLWQQQQDEHHCHQTIDPKQETCIPSSNPHRGSTYSRQEFSKVKLVSFDWNCDNLEKLMQPWKKR